MPTDTIQMCGLYCNGDELMYLIEASAPECDNHVTLYSKWPLPESGFVMTWQGTWDNFKAQWSGPLPKEQPALREALLKIHHQTTLKGDSE